MTAQWASFAGLKPGVYSTVREAQGLVVWAVIVVAEGLVTKIFLEIDEFV